MIYQRLLRPLLFLFPPATAHALAAAALWPAEHLPAVRDRLARAHALPPGTPWETMGLQFPSPIGLAGGFDKNAQRARALGALGFGFLELGTVTALPQAANPAPNLFRLPADRALINRLGFPNDGAATVAARLAACRSAIPVPVGLSIGKSRAVPADDLDRVVADYLTSFRHVLPVADFVVVNISSPNTVGLRGMQTPALARRLLGALSAANQTPRRPILVKLAPDLTDDALRDLLAVVQDEGLDGVIAANTSIGRHGLATPAARLEAIGAGGVSGPPLRARALDMVQRARAQLGANATIIGVGGIETPEHVHAFLQAGANLVQVYTGFIYQGPTLAWRLARALTHTLPQSTP